MNRKAFTLIELAIVLTVIGLVVGGSFKVAKTMRERNKITEAKEYVKAATDATIGYAMEWVDLPTPTEFTDELSPSKGVAEGKIFYFSDPALANDIDICAFNTTDLNVTIYDNSVLQRTIDNVAFVIAARSANRNMQTGITGSNPYTIRVDDHAERVDRNNSDFIRASDEYDDFVKWVTLAELQHNARCSDTPLRIVNNKLPDADTNTSISYSATIVIDGNFTPPASSNCNITTPYDDDLQYDFGLYKITNKTPKTNSTRPSGTAVINCTFTMPNGRTVSKPFVITINP